MVLYKPLADKLEIELKKVDISLKEFQTLREIKHSSNVLFHSIKDQSVQAKI
jgi:hypothetical protein